MKVLSIGSDRRLFEEGSNVSRRIREYGALVEELHIIVFALKSSGLREKQLATNVWVYPTNSFSKWFYLYDAARLGKSLIFNKKFVRGKSLITVQDLESGWAGMKIKKKWRIPLEVQIHTDIFSPYFNGLQNRIRKILAKKILSSADAVRVVSENIKLQVSKITKARVFVLPIYVDKQSIEDEKILFDLHARYGWHFIILAVSRLSSEKNLDLAIRVLRVVRNKFLDTGLVIVGSGPEEDRLKRLVKELDLTGAVEFAGWQTNLGSFYKTANLFIQTSFFEGYGLSLVEAGLSNLPIITTPVGVALELEHGKDAYIYPVDRPDLFAAGIVDLIENNQRRQNLRINIKHALESRLLSKGDYLEKMKAEWVNTAKK